jgi:hypothetical protein
MNWRTFDDVHSPTRLFQFCPQNKYLLYVCVTSMDSFEEVLPGGILPEAGQHSEQLLPVQQRSSHNVHVIPLHHWPHCISGCVARHKEVRPPRLDADRRHCLHCVISQSIEQVYGWLLLSISQEQRVSGRVNKFGTFCRNSAKFDGFGPVQI